jgi:hypothetical protein
MKRPFGPGAPHHGLHRLLVAQVDFHHLELPGHVLEAPQVVAGTHDQGQPVAVVEQSTHDVGPDEPGATGDEGAPGAGRGNSDHIPP